MGYEWDVSTGQQLSDSDEQEQKQVRKDLPHPKKKKKKRRAVMPAAAGQTQDKQRSDWTAAEKSAIRRYAKEKMRPWNEVTFNEVATTTEGISGWQKRVGKELTIQQKKYWQA